MTPSEFKAWFDGFTEALDGIPSEAQWKRIKARVAEIDGRTITEHVWVNRYLPHYWVTPYMPNYVVPPYVLCGSSIGVGASGAGTMTMTNAAANSTFDSHSAMLSLGRAEASELN